ncbi:MAG: cellulase family glycosylhydrolase [Gaiellaceae bacterium]
MLALAVLSACGVTATGIPIASAAHSHGGKPHRGKPPGKSHGGKSHGGKVISTPATAPLQTGVFDPFLAGIGQEEGFSMIRAAGGSYVRVLVRWSRIAPALPPLGFDASNPESLGYWWAGIDGTVSAAEAAGLTPILDIGGAPGWAIVPSTVGTGPGTPQAQALGDFATALATHFDGNHGAPAAHVFQVWNEPNHRRDLSPVNGATYRGMVNAVATGVHGVNASNVVVAGGLDPRGSEAAGGFTQAPLAFMRAFLCISHTKKQRATCNDPVHMDAWSMHPYSYYGPTAKAKGHDNVSLGDLQTMDALLEVGVNRGQVVSSHPVQFWVTEFSWDTNPPRSGAVPAALEASWADEAFHQMWISGVSLVTWFMLEDEGGTTPWQSGLYYHSPTLSAATPKPMLTAFEFPFVASFGKKHVVSIWGRDATSSADLITIQQRNGSSGSFKTVGLVKANKYGIFLATLRLKATQKSWLRATASGSGSSLPFPLRRPSTNRKYSPWGR